MALQTFPGCGNMPDEYAPDCLYSAAKKEKSAMEKDRTRRMQMWCAAGLVVTGCGLLIAGFIVAPTGEIHSSVLVGFGETLTFAGAIFGIDYRYKSK